MKDCDAFCSKSFWSPNWELNESEWAAQNWLEPLRATFGLQPEVRTYFDTFDKTHRSYETQTIEIELPITPTAALVWQTYDDAHERTLLLREPGEPDATLGWIDSHGHPYALHPEEAISLGAAAAQTNNWKASPVPLLLLDNYVALTTEDDVALWTSAKRAALCELGSIEPGGLEVMGTEEGDSVQQQIGQSYLVYNQSGETFRVLIQGGVSWRSCPQWDRQLVAHKSWDTIRHLRDFDWPVPCHTIRNTNPYQLFPQAASEVAKSNEEGGSADPDWPIFPFARFKRLMEIVRSI